MRSVWLPLLVISCAHEIPHRTVPDKPAALPGKSIGLQPCVLVHLQTEENLSDAARGPFRGKFQLSYSTFVLQHPKGLTLIDAAFGKTAAQDLDDAPFWFRWQFSEARQAQPLSSLIDVSTVKYVLLTHAHWDHTGGLREVPNAQVMLPKSELSWIAGHHEGYLHGAMPRHLENARVDPFAFDGPAYEGFPSSHDVFGDGSVIAVPTPGHTPGATSYFVNSTAGRWLFIGDAAWVREGFSEPVERGRAASIFADADAGEAADSLGYIHAIYESHAANIVTSHDARTWTGIPRCPALPAQSR